MKKYIMIGLLVSSLSLVTLNAMEETQDVQMTDVQETNNWDSLPQEVKLHLLSFLPKKGNYSHWLTAMLVNKEWNELLKNQSFLNDFAKNLLRQCNCAIELNSFLDAAIENNNTKIVKALISTSPSLLSYASSKIDSQPSFNPECANTLFQAGMVFNTPKWTASLERAISRDERDKAQWLVEHGTNLNDVKLQGQSVQNYLESYRKVLPEGRIIFLENLLTNTKVNN